jgi:ribosomal protein S18 acetylase RimI-like enzyme
MSIGICICTPYCTNNLNYLNIYSAYYNDVVVGGVCCRIDTTEDQRRLYIMTLGCLAPYRRAGIGTKMLQHVLKYVEDDGNFDSIFL